MSPEENPNELPKPPDDVTSGFPELTGQSREMLETLTRLNVRAAHFYEGALRALADRSNPVRAESAAYCLRELIVTLERTALAPKVGPSLGDLLKNFRPQWEEAARRSDDNGLQDHCDPAVFAVDQFLEDAATGYEIQRDRAQMMFSELDPVQRHGPSDIHEARIQSWLDFRGEFNRNLHGEEPTDPEWFASRVEGFESFLLAWFRPRTFDDFSEIDELLEEGPPA